MSVGQLLGGAVGFFLGGPQGARLGFMIGGWLDPVDQPDIVGPRLSDLTVQTSQDGAPLPVVYGTMRVAGNVFWTTGIQEIRHKEEAGGGSGGPSQDIISYTYQTDIAVGICAGEIQGIRRVWADSKLIYDIGNGADYSTLTASTKRAKAMRVYPGSESQGVDPLIEAVEGTAYAPAFLGTAYIVFEDLKLADFGNRVPNFTFEVVKAGGAAGLQALQTSSAIPSGDIISVRRKKGELTKVITRHGALAWNGTTYPHLIRWWYLLPDGSWVLRFENVIHHIGLYHWAGTGYTVSGDDDYDSDDFVLSYPASISKMYLVRVTGANGMTFHPMHYSLLAGMHGHMTADYVAFTTNTEVRIFRRDSLPEVTPTWGTWGGYYGAGISYTPAAEEPGWLATITLPTGEHRRASVLIVRDTLHVMTHASPTNTIYSMPMQQLLDAPGQSWTSATLTYTTEVRGAYLASALGLAGGSAQMMLYSSGQIYLMDADGVWGSSLGSTTGFSFSIESSQPAQVSDLVYAMNNATREYMVSDGLLTSAAEALDVVVEDVLDQAGVTAYDVSALSGLLVRGYTLARPMPMRQGLEPLMAAYHFDVVEVDGEMRAILRGGASARTLTDDDLGAGETATARMTTQRGSLTEMPSRVDVQFVDYANDYQSGMQFATRITANHTNIVQVQLPMALTTQEAAQLAEIHLNQAWWSGQYGIDTALTFDHLALHPSDVVTLPVHGETPTARITEVTAGAPGIMQVRAVPDLASLYTGSAVGADAINIAQALGITGPMRGVLMDCVMLRDTDDAPGLYVAGCGYVDTWPSGTVQMSADGGATYGQAAVVSNAAIATIGYTTTALGDADCRVWDKKNTVTVKLLAGATLSSATEAAVLNGANALLIGAHGRWELIQFQTATLNGDGTYTLRDLLRGRKGTEWAASQHATWDTVVLLTSATVSNIVLPTSAVGATRHYKAVTSGYALEDVQAEALTYGGERMECLAPVLLGGGRDASGNITINWVRRDRNNAGWNNNADIPMSEATQSYEVEVWDSTYTTIKRTITGISTTTTSYSSANQTTDFGSNQSTVYLRVYQLSATTGRGHVLQGTV